MRRISVLQDNIEYYIAYASIITAQEFSDQYVKSVVVVIIIIVIVVVVVARSQHLKLQATDHKIYKYYY